MPVNHTYIRSRFGDKRLIHLHHKSTLLCTGCAIALDNRRRVEGRELKFIAELATMTSTNIFLNFSACWPAFGEDGAFSAFNVLFR